MTFTTLFVNDKSNEAEKSNLLAEDKWIHKFAKVASWEREKQISCQSPHFLSEWLKLGSNENLPAEDKRMHKFPKVGSGERENKIYVAHHTFCQNDTSYKVEKSNLPTEHKWMHKFTKVTSEEKNKIDVTHQFSSEW